MKTYWVNDIRYRQPMCPHLQGESESVNKVCGLDGQPLSFYDWHIAHCNEKSMRLTEEEAPSIGSYWLDPRNKRFRVIMVTNKRAKKEQYESHPLMVVCTDGMAARDQSQFWSLPLERWKQTMTLIPPSQV